MCSRQLMGGNIMCDKCDDLEKQIATYRRFLAYGLDALTTERFKAQIKIFEDEKKSLHSQRRSIN